MRGSPALSVQLTPGGSGQGLEVPRIADFTHRPGLEPATGEEPAPNFLLSQWDHGSRPALPAPKVRENHNMLAHEAWLEGFVGRGGSYPSSGGSSMKMYLSSYELGNGVEKLKGLLPSNRKAGCIFNALDKFPAEKQRHVETDIAALIEIGLQAELLDLQMYFNKESQLREK